MGISLDVKRKVMAFLMAITMFVGIASPQIVSANNDFSGLEVTVGEDGALNFSGGGMQHETGADAWNGFIAKYKNFIVGISAIGAVTMILFFIMQLLKLGGTAGNPQARSQVLTGLIWSGVAAAALGSVSIIVGFFYNALK